MISVLNGYKNRKIGVSTFKIGKLLFAFWCFCFIFAS